MNDTARGGTARSSSIAGRAFEVAEERLHGLGFADPRTSPPLGLVVPGWLPSGRSAAPARTAPTASAPKASSADQGLTVCSALAQMSAGQLTSSALVEMALERADKTSALGAVVSIDSQAAMQEARRLDDERAAGNLRGPLHGVTVTVKDVIDVKGLPTRGGSLAYLGQPVADAPAVARLREAGALILAKVATHEFALGVTTPQCANPHDPARISGGSSGGSAIAVSTGVGLASLGTDTRASLRVPAALCGVVGFKPTFGRVPAQGIIPLSWSIDHLGPITRTVEDGALLIDILTGGPPLDRSGQRPPGTAGVVVAAFEDADPLVTQAAEAAVGTLRAAGWAVKAVDGPSLEDLELSNDLGLLVSRSEAASFHRSNQTDLSLCIAEVRDQLTAGLTISAADYLDAQRQRAILSSRVMTQFALCDVLVMPTSPVVAPLKDDYERYLLRLSRNTILWSLMGAPAISVPCGLAEHGLPTGVQLAAAPGNEQAVVDAGITVQQGAAELRQ